MCNVMGTLLCRGGSGGGGQHVVGEDEVGLQREMGLVSGISLIVGEPIDLCLPNLFLGQVQSWGLAFGKPLAP